MPLAIAECRLVVLLILLTVWISACAAQYTYDIYPICPTNKECLTLSDIVNERDKYFTSNVTLVFHRGDHSLQDEAVSVANVSNLTLQGSTTSSGSGAPATRIVCVNSSLFFSGVFNLLIDSINFVSCRSSLSFTVAVFQDCSFENSTGVNGGAMSVTSGSSVTFFGLTVFSGNTATWNGGAIYADNSAITFSGRATCVMNQVLFFGRGGELCADEHNTLSFNGTSTFEGNTADHGGALYANENNTLSFSGTSYFKGNTAFVNGGAFFAKEKNTLSFNGNSNFEGNTADSGGSLCSPEHNTLSFTGNTSFEGNKATTTGGALSYSNCSIVFDGSTSFSSNTALFGGAIYAVNSVTKLTESSMAIRNNATYGGGVFVQGGRITFEGTGSYTENSALQDGYGGAILAINSIVEFNGSYQLPGNTAGFGGGMALIGIKDRTLLLNPGTNLSFHGNAAHKRGGALYVKDNPFTYCIFNTTTKVGVRDACFIQSFDPEQHVCNFITDPLTFRNATGRQFNYSLNFESNNAVESGDVLYGGGLESCGVCLPRYYGDFYPFQGSTVFAQVTNANMYSQFELSSDPYKVCICENNQPNCNQRTVNTRVYPGHMLSLAVVSVGQMDGVVPSVIRAVPENLIITSDFKDTQPAENNKSCTELQYPLLSEEMNATLKLYSDEPCSTSGLPLTVHITFLPCPVGFNLSDQGMCICEERLQKYTQTCTIDTLTIRRDHGNSFWVGLTDTSKPGLILHPHCPSDYCTEEALDFTLNSTDLQCSNGRSGVLCGGCQSGHSLALGSSRCLSGCSNKFLALLLAFATAGVVLVAFLFLCRLTVAEGTLSGLIFYANVLAVNRSLFFPANTTNILTVFIAWLNLDLGIETCFFVDLDAYSRTWLQIVFPIYIWVLVGLIIYLADVTTTFARIIGRTNPVAVLATLFLLSYTKLLRAIMAAFSFTSLDYPDTESRLVWLYDGNIGYLDKQDGRHITLFLVNLLVFLFVFLPYTLFLLCGQWIQKNFQLRWLSPTKQLYLKAFLDAYYAPFHDKHRYWTGLLLLLRFFIVLLSTLVNIENPQDPFVSLAVLLCVLAGMLLWSWLTAHKLYKRWYLNILEASFMFNLIVLIGGTYQIRQSGGNQAALVYTSVSIAFTTFIGIVISGVVQQINEELQRRRRFAHQQNNTDHRPNREEESPPHSPANVPKGVTYSVVEITGRSTSDDSRDIEMTPI